MSWSTTSGQLFTTTLSRDIKAVRLLILSPNYSYLSGRSSCWLGYSYYYSWFTSTTFNTVLVHLTPVIGVIRTGEPRQEQHSLGQPFLYFCLGGQARYLGNCSISTIVSLVSQYQPLLHVQYVWWKTLRPWAKGAKNGGGPVSGWLVRGRAP